jgi:hypothetical protein
LRDGDIAGMAQLRCTACIWRWLIIGGASLVSMASARAARLELRHQFVVARRPFVEHATTL